MIDKSWMLNPQAIRHAKACIQIIRERKNIKLKLSQPDFFQQLDSCSRNIRSAELLAAHHQLMAMAESYTGESKQPANVVPLTKRKNTAAKMVAQAVDSIETVAFGGKHYPKWQAGKAFHGLYRGQPHYQ